MDTIRDALKKRYKKATQKKTKRAKVQVIADRIFQELQLTDYKMYPSLCRLVKRNKEAHLISALSWTKDYPHAKNKFKLYAWKVSQIRKSK